MGGLAKSPVETVVSTVGTHSWAGDIALESDNRKES
jgi:hypothetical protein